MTHGQAIARVVRIWLVGILAFATLMGVGITAGVGAESGDFDDNAVIRGGVFSKRELKQKCASNNRDIKAVFQHYGINCPDDITGMVEGRITRDARVLVDGKVVATDAVTAGRQDMPRGSKRIMGGKFYEHAAGANMAAGVNSLEAYVKMDNNGQFKYAVMKSCGNPVVGKPKPPKQQPKPQPQPEQPKKPDLSIQKDVRIKGQSFWSDGVRVKPGDVVEYRVVIKNSGETDLVEAKLRDTLPTGITAAGTYTVNGQVSSGDVSALVIDLSTFLELNEQVEIIFAANVGTSVEACNQGLVNTAMAEAKDVPPKSDTSTVVVCKLTPTPTPTPMPPAPAVQAAVTPTKLVNTGPAETALAILAAVALGSGLYYLKLFYQTRWS